MAIVTTSTTCTAPRCDAPATHAVTVMTEAPRRYTAADGEPYTSEERRATFDRCPAHVRMSATRSVRRLNGEA